MSAVIDGVSWNVVNAPVSQQVVTAVLAGGAPDQWLTASGLDAAAHVTLSLVAVSGPGTYALTSTSVSQATLGSGVAAPPGAASQGWSTQRGGSGTIVITALSSTRVSGTFELTLVPVPGTGASGTRSVTQGVFDIAFGGPS